MKTKRAIIIGFLIITILFTLFAFLLWPDRDMGFYASYIFVMLGFAAFFGSMYMVVSEKFEKMPWRVPALGIGRSHMIAAILITAAYAVLSLLTGVIDTLMGTALLISMTVYILLHFGVVAWTAYKINALLAGANVINEVNDKRHGQAAALRALASEAEAIRAQVDKFPADIRGETSALIGKVAEALKYSDPIVPERLAGIDDSIRDGINNLRQAVDTLTTDVTGLLKYVREEAEKLLRMIKDRNEQVKRAK